MWMWHTSHLISTTVALALCLGLILAAAYIYHMPQFQVAQLENRYLSLHLHKIFCNRMFSGTPKNSFYSCHIQLVQIALCYLNLIVNRFLI